MAISTIGSAGLDQAANTTFCTTSGNVGIGTTSPGYKVEMAITSGSNFYSATTSAVGQDVGYRLASTATSGREYRISTSDPTRGSYGAGLAFVDATAGAARMLIDSSGNLQFNSGYGSVATAYGCRAWVNFNGTGTVAIRSSGNVSSITDGGVGIYRVNFSTSMPDVNFSTNASVAGGGTVNSSTCAFLVNATSAAAGGQTSNVAYVDVWCYHPGNQVAQDNAWCSVSVFR